jgi:hypothetical protein
VVAGLKAQAQSAARAELQKLEQGIGMPVPTSVAGAKKIAGREAQKVANEAFRKMGVPAIPLSFPKELSADAVKDVAYASGKTYIEGAVKAKFGVPISLPAKLTAKEIGRSVGAIVPTNVEGVVDLGLAIGTQAAASAVTSLLVGAGVGSVIPGLGTIIGIGAALGVAALKGVVKDLIKPRGRKCNRPWTCPEIPSKLSPIELLPWIAPHYVAVHRAIAEQDGFRKSEPCVRGPTMECYWLLNQLGLRIFDLGVAKTPLVMGGFQLDRLIPLYENALRQFQSVGLPRGLRTGGQDSMLLILQRMKARKAELAALQVQANRELASGRRPTSALRFKLVTELKDAAVQVQFAPGPETLNWYRAVAVYVDAITKADAAAQQRMHVEQAARRKVGEERMKDPTQAAAHNIQALQFRCGDGHQPSCVELRRLQGTAAPPRPAPPPAARPRPRPPRPQPSPPRPRPPSPRPPPRPQPKPRPSAPAAAAGNIWRTWLRAAHAAQVRRVAVPPPPPLPPKAPPGTPPVWVAWLNRARRAQIFRRPVPFPPAIPAAWVR